METLEPETARLTADAVLFGMRGKVLHVLLIRRVYEPYAGCWALPGGHVDVGEKFGQAARRELREETGLDVPNLEPLGAYGDPGRDPRGRYVTFAHTAMVVGTPEPDAGDDAAEAHWFPVGDVLAGEVVMAFDHAKILNAALSFAIGTTMSEGYSSEHA